MTRDSDLDINFERATTREYSGHKKKVHSLAWNCDGRKLGSGSVDQTCRVWTIESHRDGKELELKGHSDSVDQITWDPTHPDQLATASGDRTVKVWDTRSGKCSSSISTSGENINISWSPDGNHIAVGNRDDIITFIDTRKFKVINTTKFPIEVNEISWNKSGDLFFLTTGLGTVEVMNYPSLQQLNSVSLVAHTASCYCISFDQSGKYFATGGADALVGVWDLEHMACSHTISRLEWPVRTVSFSCNSQYIASASEDLVIDIAHAATGKMAYQIPTHGALNTLEWNPHHMLLAYAGDVRDDIRSSSSGRSEMGKFRIFGFPPR